MSEAFHCDSCGEFYTGRPAFTGSIEGNPFSDGVRKARIHHNAGVDCANPPADPQETVRWPVPAMSRSFEVCADCYVKHIHEGVLSTFGEEKFPETQSLQEAYADGGLRAEAGLDFTKTEEWSDEKRAALADELGDISDAQGVRTEFGDIEDDGGEKPQPPSPDKVMSRRTGMVYDKREKPIAGLALMLIADSAGVTAKALSNQLDANIATIRTSLDRFEEENVVESEERDGKTYYTITDRGEGTLETYEQQWREGKKKLPNGYWD